MLTPIPSKGYYLIQKLDPSDSSIIHTKEKEPPFIKGVVLKVGGNLVNDYNALIEPEYKVGDTVLYSFSGFEDISEDGSGMHLIRFHAVVGKYESQ